MTRIPARLLVPQLLALGSLLALSACGGDDLTRTFGLTRDAPDEFRVTTRAPLSMPPDYTLRPPRPGATRPQELPLATQAEATLVPEAALGTAAGSQTPGQSALLSAAGPNVNGDIRTKVDSEAQLDRPSQSFTDRLMFWRDAPPPGTVVDATKESRRLRENAALGQNNQVGDTPVIQPKPTGLLDGIF
jgi:hypothetical protein